MRVDDLPVPDLVPHQVPPGAPVARWGAGLRIAIEQAPAEPYVWDAGTVWDDDPDPALLWDADRWPAGWVDAVCDFQALSIDTGVPDELGLYPAASLTLSLDDRSGAWSTWTATGRLARFAVGNRVAVWADYRGDDRWLFFGRVTRWAQQPATATVVVEAHDGFALLAPPVGVPWVAGGVNLQTPLARITDIAAAATFPDPVDGDPGDNPLTIPPEDPRSPLEAMQRVALSDGGVVAVDADGRLIYRDRRWREGRADQPRVWLFTDRACDTGALAVWDPVVDASDDGAVTEVRLQNVAGTTVVALGAPAPVALRLAHPDPDLWNTSGEGQVLADWLLASQAAPPGYQVRSFALHLTDPHQVDLWDAGTSLRRGDRFAWVTDLAAGRLDVDVIVAGYRHDITPDDWLVTCYGTRAVAARTALPWDWTSFTWDDPNPSNVWSS